MRYGSSLKLISSLTNSEEIFADRVVAATHGRENATRTGHALQFCVDLLKDLGDVPKIIVLFGDGSSNKGADPVTVSKSFRDSGGEIAAVATDSADLGALRNLVDSESKLFDVRSFRDMVTLGNFIENLS